MKKTIVRLLVAVLLIGSLVGMLAACGGTKEVTVTVMDGDTAIKTITLEKGAKLDIKLSDVTKEGGYECTGLFTDAEMTAALGKDVTVEEDMTLYAGFRLKTLYLFAYDRISDEEERFTVTAGGSYSLPTPTREGYRFLGYTYGGEPFPQTGTYSYTDSITVKVDWDKILYLSFVDGKTTKKVEVAADGSFALPNLSDTATHTFGGYMNDTVPFGTYDEETGKWVGTYTGTADLSLTCHWVEKHKMEVNGLDGQSSYYKTGESYTLPAAPEKAGYRFLGYKMNGQPFAATGIFTWSEDITVTAEWSPIVYINVYDGSSFVKKVEVAADGSFALDDVNDAAGEKTFEGYVMGTTAFGTYDEETGKWTGTYTGTEDATVMYKWEDIVHAYITFNGIGLDPILIEEGETSYQLYTIKPERPGFRFEGFTKGTETVTGDTYTLTGDEATTGVVLTAVWSEIYYITIYDGNTAKPQKIEVAADGTVTLPKQDDKSDKLFAGYTMGGVTFTKNGDGTYSASGITGHKDAYISWYVLPVVSFDTKGGAFEEAVDTVILTIGQNTLPIPTMEGFEFDGWYWNTTKFTGENALYTLAEDSFASGTTLHLVARWKQSSNGSNEVAGYNYFKESDGNGGYIYVFLTGTDNTYSFSGYTLSFQNNNDVVTQKSDNSFVADKPGSFQMTMTPTAGGAPVTVFCRVENRINGFTSGKNTDAGYASNFQSGIIDSVIDAGMEDLVPHVLVNGIHNNASTTLSFSDIPFDIALEYKADGDDEYEPYTAENGYTVKGGAITFTDELLHGKTVRVTLSPKYALSAEKAKQTVTFEYLLNDGVNVYTDAELYENFKTLSVKTINVQRDITAKLHASECACSNPAYGAAPCSGDHKYPINQWGTGAYVRNLGTDADSITLNGNHYKLDGSTLPKIELKNPGGQYSEDNGGYGGSGDATDANGLAYKTVNVQAGIISYYSPNGNDALDAQTLVVNDLYMTGNNTEAPDRSDGVNGIEDKNRVLVGSMTFHGITTRRANLTATNVTLQNMHISLFNAGYEEMDPKRLTTAITLDGVRIDNSFSNHLYNWGQVGVTIMNSALKQASGAAIHFDDSPLPYTEYEGQNVASFLSIDEATTVENYVLGTEPWFNAYGMLSAATSIKTEIQTLIAASLGQLDAALGMPAGALLPDITPSNAVTTIEGKGQVFNLVCVIKEGTGENDEWKQDKEYMAINAATQSPVTYDRGSAYVRILPADPKKEFKITDASSYGIPPYACFDSRLYVNKSLDVFGSAGVIIGLSE